MQRELDADSFWLQSSVVPPPNFCVLGLAQISSTVINNQQQKQECFNPRK